jgi:endogenous inhibitor of DNA gyrase (YacG/DUF329 family)
MSARDAGNDNRTPTPDAVPKPARTPACPICGRPVDARLHPFCSKRCADVDLARWLGGTYRIASDEPDLESGENSEDDEK